MAEKLTRAERRVNKLIEKAKKSIRQRENTFYIAPEITDNAEAMLEILESITTKRYLYDFEKDNRVKHFAEFVGEDLLKNGEFILKASELKYTNYGSTASLLDFVKDYSKRVALILVKKDPSYLRKMSTSNRDDEDVVMTAVRGDGNVLQAASDRLKDNVDIVRTAISNCPTAIQYASGRLKNNYELGKFAVNKSGFAFQYLSEGLRDNEDIALIAVRDPETLAIVYASDRLKDNRDVATEAVRANGNALEHLSVERRSEHDIVSYAIGHSPALVKNASNRYLYSEPLLFKAVRQTTAVLEYVPEEMRKVMVEMLDNYESANRKFNNADEENTL